MWWTVALKTGEINTQGKPDVLVKDPAALFYI